MLKLLFLTGMIAAGGLGIVPESPFARSPASTRLAADSPVASTGDTVPRGVSGKLRGSVFSYLTQRPFADKVNGRIGQYLVGFWPGERKSVTSEAYRNPSRFIEVTRENKDTYISEHFRLRDFLTKNQANVWPKYLVLELRLVDKLELVLNDLASRGVAVKNVTVMSGFRTPSYNAGGGNTAGRGALSRHMYGDAMDWFVDNDGRHEDPDVHGNQTSPAEWGRLRRAGRRGRRGPAPPGDAAGPP